MDEPTIDPPPARIVCDERLIDDMPGQLVTCKATLHFQGVYWFKCQRKRRHRGNHRWAHEWDDYDTGAQAALDSTKRTAGAPVTEREQARTELLPTESMALTVALAQVLRGDTPPPNTATVCVLALARLDGRHDWTADV